MPSQLRRFWAKVERTDGCWNWIGATGKIGYGNMLFDGRVQAAHRLSWQIHNGPIPTDRWVLHHCDNRRCVRPDHLFLGDGAANTADMMAKGRGHSPGPIIPLRGEAAPRHKLTSADVIEIDRLLKAGVVQTRIGERFHVHRVLVSLIKRRLRWKHLFEARA